MKRLRATDRRWERDRSEQSRQPDLGEVRLSGDSDLVEDLVEDRGGDRRGGGSPGVLEARPERQRGDSGRGIGVAIREVRGGHCGVVLRN